MTIRERRDALGINQTEAAERLGLKQSYYSRIERGRENPTIGVFERLSDLYNAEVDELVREYLEVRATLPDADNGANPGWMCLPPLTAISATVARTLVPFLPRPLAHPA